MSSTFIPSGVYPALPTPIADDGSINLEASSAHLRYLEEGGVHGVVPAGCTGHAATLGDRGDGLFDEHVEYVAHVASATDLPVIAGDGMNSTTQTIDLATAIEDRADIAAHLMISPYQNRPPQDRIVAHYRRIAEAVEQPIIAYNVPSRTGRNLTAETTLELGRIEGVVGVKEASLDFEQIHQIAMGIETDNEIEAFVLGSGDDAANHYVYQQGGTFAISVTGNVHPVATRSVWDAGVADGDHVRAFRLNQDLMDLHEALFQEGESNPISVQYALNRLGFDFGVPRPPLDRPPRQDETYHNREEIEAALAAYDLG